MKSRLMRLAGATALAATMAAATAPALAGGPGWGGGYYGGPGGYHGGYRGGHSSGWSSADRWIVGGAIGLITAGLLLSANSQPSYSYAPTVQMGSNGYAYMSPGYGVALTQAPVYVPPPVYVQPPVYAPAPVYAPPVYEPAAAPAIDPADPASINLAPAPVAQASAASGHADCARYAMNQSGFDPAGASQWTTQIMVDSYNRALQTCRDQHWGS
ncbi:hypothetical protein [Bordetella genomosp. 12]|uniref:Lipoprotein n=1 Tax=Bordetella genomosp. 12 TaxID=463035 RepID=A0A261VLY1_9BORD|nr:hypothetical protein [Bordetella genomosp. 12]OZI75069.1 hypothetical protein CAL22_11710 [Bordetella genomosp. 12]